MKKFALSLLAAVLLLTLVCGSAFAVTGDLTIKATTAYADPAMTQPIGTIPKFTSVLVRAYGSYADVYVNGVECYVKPSALTQGAYDYNYIGAAVLKKGANVYQRPNAVAKFATTSKDHKVLVYSASNGYALIRGSNGVFGFTSTDNLASLKAY